MIHEELHRLVLRARWIRWSLRNYRLGDYRIGSRHMVLSERLTKAKPTYQQRKREGDF